MMDKYHAMSLEECEVEQHDEQRYEYKNRDEVHPDRAVSYLGVGCEAHRYGG